MFHFYTPLNFRRPLLTSSGGTEMKNWLKMGKKWQKKQSLHFDLEELQHSEQRKFQNVHIFED